MASDLINCLQLDSNWENGRVIVAREINGCDSSFITSCILSHAIKNKRPVLLVLSHNSLSHYHNVGLRMFYNLKKSIESGLVKVFDVAENDANILLQNRISLDATFSKLTNHIFEMQNSYREVNVIIDGVSHFLDLQYSIKDVNKFCKQIVEVLKTSNHSFVLFHCNVAFDDDQTLVMSNLLSHMAHIVVEVETLSSGWSADVSGHLKVTYPGRKFDDKFMFNMDLPSSQYLFKLFDKGVKLFAPGTV